MNGLTTLIMATVVLVTTTTAFSQQNKNLLFIRGAARSGGFLEASNDASRTEHLADINNTSTSNGNHGWSQLRITLENAGYLVNQITETVEAGNPSGPSQGVAVPFETLNLSSYGAVVFGSNNAVYGSPQVNAVEDYIRGGGGALFISDANFGGNWADAANSDQQFLDRFGLIMHQDQGTYALERSNNEFLVPDHPIFAGVNQFDGEGVSPIEIGTLTAGVSATILSPAKGNTRLNPGGSAQGSSRRAGPNDAALIVASADAGRIVGLFDRNTFFNQNGAGTNINRFQNRQLALNIFSHLTTVPEPGMGPVWGTLAIGSLLRRRR
jgi:hypothetical protein